MKHIILLFFTASFFFFTAPEGISGTLMISSSEVMNGSSSKSTSKAYLDKNRMRIETADSHGDNVMIYRRDRDLFWVIDKSDNSYMEMTAQDVKKMRGQLDEAMAEMEKQMQAMPPEQRKLMEQMMKGRMPQVGERITYRKETGGVTVNQWTCTRYVGYRKGEKVREICTTDRGSLGLSEDDIALMEGMSSFFRKLSQGSRSHPFYATETEQERGYEGIPVRTVFYHVGGKKHVHEISEVKNQSFPASLFELPAGLKKKEYSSGY